MKRRWIIPAFLALCTLTQCKEEMIEQDASLILHNASDYPVEVRVFSGQDSLSYNLAAQDSLVNPGFCITGFSQYCEFDWGFADSEARVEALRLIFAEEKTLFYQSSGCDGSRNPIGGSEFGPDQCGYEFHYPDEQLYYVYDITNEDYEAAEPIEE